MDKDAQIADAFSRSRAQAEMALPAKVDAVNDKLIDVTTVDGDQLYGIRLQASEKATSFIEPQQGSWVIIAPLHGQNAYVVVSFSAIERVVIEAKKIEEKVETWHAEADEFAVDSEKVRFQSSTFAFDNNKTGLKSILADLVSALKALTVTTGTGPSGTPINISQFIKVEQQINNLFE